MQPSRARNGKGEPFVMTAQQDAANSNCIKRGQLVNDAHQVAAHSLRWCNWPTRVLDDAKAFLLFSWRLTIPNDLKNREVPKIKHEIGKHYQGHKPDSSLLPAGQAHAHDHHDHEEADAQQNFYQS